MLFSARKGIKRDNAGFRFTYTPSMSHSRLQIYIPQAVRRGEYTSEARNVILNTV